MKEEKLALRLAQLKAAEAGDVPEAAEQLFIAALEELDSAIAESERDLNEAEVLYEEAESAGGAQRSSEEGGKSADG